MTQMINFYTNKLFKSCIVYKLPSFKDGIIISEHKSGLKTENKQF